MNGVGIADQRRASYTAHQPTRRGCICLFFFPLNAYLINAHLFFMLARTEAFIDGIDTRDIRSDQVATHGLDCSVLLTYFVAR